MVRGFNFENLLDDVEKSAMSSQGDPLRSGQDWRAFDVDVAALKADGAFRLAGR
jgi:hypothetical protein